MDRVIVQNAVINTFVGRGASQEATLITAVNMAAGTRCDISIERSPMTHKKNFAFSIMENVRSASVSGDPLGRVMPHSPWRAFSRIRRMYALLWCPRQSCGVSKHTHWPMFQSRYHDLEPSGACFYQGEGTSSGWVPRRRWRS